MSDNVVREHVQMIPAGHEGPKVVIFSAFNDAYAPLADIARPNWKAYAEKHGYAVRFYPQSYHLDPSRPETYGDKCRFECYFDLLGHADIIVNLDIDSLFVNTDVKIELGNLRFLWTYGEGGPMSGLYIARSNVHVEKHLRYAYEYAANENHVRHGKIEPNGISDQDAMTRLMHVPPFKGTFGNCVPASSIGFDYPDTATEKTWIVTCRGGSFESKVEAMKEWRLKTDSQYRDGFAGLTTIEAPHHVVPAYDSHVEFDRNWVGPANWKPRVYRTQSEKDTFFAVAVENEYGLGKLEPDDVVIDIGAHIGSFSYLAYRQGSRSIYAFEIDPWHMEAAVVNLGDMKDGVALYHTAVVRGDAGRASEYHYDGAWNSFGHFGPTVTARSLDEIIGEVVDPVRFLKIDCEGGEWPILGTCTKFDRIQEIAGEFHVIDASAPELQNLPLEISVNGLRTFLESKGFEVEFTQADQSIGGFHARRTAVAARPNFGTVVRLG